MSGILVYIHDSDLNLLNTLPSSLAGSIGIEIARQNSNNHGDFKYYVVATEFPPIGKKFINGQWIEMSLQEKVDVNIINIADYKQDAHYRIETEARAYMDKATTPSGKRVSVYDCMMALLTIHYELVPDNDPTKQLRQSQGFILQSSVVSGMMNTLAELNLGVYNAKQAINNASGVVQIDSVKFEDYI